MYVVGFAQTLSSFVMCSFEEDFAYKCTIEGKYFFCCNVRNVNDTFVFEIVFPEYKCEHGADLVFNRNDSNLSL